MFVPVVKMFVIAEVVPSELPVVVVLQAENDRGPTTRAIRHMNAMNIRISQRGALFVSDVRIPDPSCKLVLTRSTTSIF